MATVTVDSTSQRYTSATQPEPDVLLLHTTEGMSWPGYRGGADAPHDTVRAIPGKGIEVRRHYPYDQYSKSLENDAGGVQTNKRGVIQVELRGTCDPKHRNDPAWYYWPAADDVVLQALADYYRPIMAKYAIPAEAMGEFVAYPLSYGDRAKQRLSFSQWTSRSGICGHQHAPENAHGDPGNFPIAKFIQYLKQEDDMPLTDADAKKLLTETEVVPSAMLKNEATVSVARALDLMMRWSLEARDNAVVARKVAEATALKGASLTPDEVKAAVKAALSEAASIEVVVKSQTGV